jgi:hypothetical protein
MAGRETRAPHRSAHSSALRDGRRIGFFALLDDPFFCKIRRYVST